MIEQERIDPKKIVIARRWTKLEYDANVQGVSVESLLREYEKVGLREKMLESHERQLETFRELHEFLGKPHFTVGEDMKRSDFSGADLTVIQGGDGHGSFTSHFLEKEKTIFVVSDKVLSKAALYDFDLDSFKQIYDCLLRGEYTVEEWTRVQSILNGKVIPELALSEMFIGAKYSVGMSRYVVQFEGKTGRETFQVNTEAEREEEQKTSGLLVATGTGSTGWMKKATLTQRRITGIFPRTESLARFIMREEPIEALSEYDLVYGELKPGDLLRITSLANNVISPDSYERVMYDFPFGAKAEIGIAAQPLRVIRSAVLSGHKPKEIVSPLSLRERTTNEAKQQYLALVA